MLYIIKNNEVYMTAKGNYNPEDFRDYFTIEDKRPNLVFNPKTKKLEPPSRKNQEEEISFNYNMEPFNSLVDLLRQSTLWDRIIDDGEKSLKLNIAVTLLIAAVTTTKNVDGFKQAIKKYFEGLESTKSAKVFDDNEKKLLQDYIYKSEFKTVDIYNL